MSNESTTTPDAPRDPTSASVEAEGRRTPAEPVIEEPAVEAPSNTRGDGHPRVGPLRAAWIFLREMVIIVSLALVLSLVAKTWFVQSFWIPSASMNDTLVQSDRVIVNKLTPGPFDISRGDIVVFIDPGGWLRGATVPATAPGLGGALGKVLSFVGVLPADEGNHLIKRVIGLPGDRVQCCSADGRLMVNGTAITEPYIHQGDKPSDERFDITVPAGHVWVMGDHRSDSADSRFNDTGTTPDDPRNGTGYYGSVPIDNVVGVAFSVIWPLQRAEWLGNPGDTFAGVPAPTTPSRAPSVTPSPTSGSATSSAP